MKKCLILGMVIFSLIFNSLNVRADDEKTVEPGTYLIDAVAEDGETKIVEKLKVTITTPKTYLDEKTKEGMDGVDFELEEDIKTLSLTELKERARVRAWSLIDGREVEIINVDIKELDSIESHLIFTTRSGTNLLIRAFNSGTEIFGTKAYENISGDMIERDWEIQFRTIFSIVFLLLLVAPVLITIAVVILIERERWELDRTLNKREPTKKRRKRKWFLILLMLSVSSTSMAAEASEIDYQKTSREIIIDIDDYIQLVRENGFEDYILDIANIKIEKEENGETISLPYTLDFANSRLLTGVHNGEDHQLLDEAERGRSNQDGKPYVTRRLKIGDHGSLIPVGIGVFIILVGIPLFYILRKRRRRWL